MGIQVDFKGIDQLGDFIFRVLWHERAWILLARQTSQEDSTTAPPYRIVGLLRGGAVSAREAASIVEAMNQDDQWRRRSAGATRLGRPADLLGQPAQVKSDFIGVIRAVLLDPAKGGQPITAPDDYSHPCLLPRYAEGMFTDDRGQVIHEPVLFVAGENKAGWFEISALSLAPASTGPQ